MTQGQPLSTDRQELFEIIVRDYRRPVAGWLARRGVPQCDIDPLTQDVFCRILMGLGELKDTERLPAWVWRIVSNAYNDYHRKRGRVIEIELGAAIEATASMPVGDPATIDAIWEAMEKLPREYQEVIKWKDFDDLTFVQIGTIRGTSAASARTLYFRARKALADHL